MANQTLVTFEGLTAEAAEEMAAGMANASKAKLELLLAQSASLGKMDDATYQRVLGMVEATKDGNGGCGWGCNN